MKKQIIFLLVSALVLQSCAIYHRNPVTAEEAAATHRRVLMIDQDGKRVKLDYIEQQNGQLVGIRHRKTVAIDQAKMLRPINRSATTWANIGMSVLGMAVFTAVVLAITFSNWDLGFGNEEIAVRPGP